MKAKNKVKRIERGIHARTDINQTNNSDNNKNNTNIILWYKIKLTHKENYKTYPRWPYHS